MTDHHPGAVPAFLAEGFHDGIAARRYHADAFCAEPTLSSSIAKTLLTATPRHAWIKHSRLNPEIAAGEESKFDLGSVAHELILGRGGGFRVIEAEDWRKKETQAARDDARANGLAPILARQMLDAWAMARAAVKRLRDIPEAAPLLGESDASLVNGRAERVMLWRDVGGALCRSMLDWHGPDETQAWDLKTTGAGLSDEAIARQIVNLGYDLSAAFYIRGLSTLLPDLAGRFRWRWCFVEDSEPFEVRVVEPTAEMLSIGDRKAALAIEKWRRCLKANDWPGYANVVTRIEPPPWATSQWMEREMVDPDALSFHPLAEPVPSQAPEIMGPF